LHSEQAAIIPWTDLKKTLNRVLNNIKGSSSLSYITNAGVVYVESKR